MGIPLAALGINQQPGPLETVGKALQLKGMQQQQQEQQYQIGARTALNKAYEGAVTMDENGQPKFDSAALTKHLSEAGYGAEAPAVLENVQKFEQGKATLAQTHANTVKLQEDSVKLQNEAQTHQQDMMGYAGAAIRAAKYDPGTADTILQHLEMTPGMPPEGKQRIDQMRQQMTQNPAILKQAADTWFSQSPAQQKLENERQVAEIRAGGTGAQPLGDKVPQVNKALAGRYQVLNPGKPLPPELTLPADATSKDFDRVDKIMQQTEQAKQSQANAEATQSQRQLTNALAGQGLELRKQEAGRKDEDFIDKNYVKPANDAEKSYQMFQNAYANRNNAKTGAESMLALSTHLATTFGNVKGSRITKDMIHEHLGARSIGDSALAAIQKLTNGDVLSPDQWDAFKGLITESRNLGWQTAKKEATRRNVDITGSLPTDLKTGASGEAPGAHPFFSQFGGSVKQ